ncbi:MAG: hypothetical protein Q8L14_14780 [Myxococcales bacterium]|nr:hypothetical protein [Myxococcales bacterium]
MEHARAVAVAAAALVGASLAWQLTLLTPASRQLSLTPAPVQRLFDGRTEYQASLPNVRTREPVDETAWVNAFRSDEPGPLEGAVARINVEGVPSPLGPDALVLRVSVQARRTGPPGAVLRKAWLRVSLFEDEAAAWMRPARTSWHPASEPAEYVMDELAVGETRTVFLHVDPTRRFGSSLGVVEVGGLDGTTGADVSLRAPLARSAFHSALADASSDFRFLTAVMLAARAVGHPGEVDLADVEQLLADSALGIPEREAFVANGVPSQVGLMGTYRGEGY